MIVRISTEGQYRLPDQHSAQLHELDEAALAAVESHDDERFQALLAEIVALVRDRGELLDDDHLGVSELILPASDTTAREARSEGFGDHQAIPEY